MASDQLAIPEATPPEVLVQLDGVAAQLELEQHPRVLGFWVRWRSLHRRFLFKLASFSAERADFEPYMQLEMDKFIRIRSRILSSTLQFFQHSDRSLSHEARIFARLFEDSDRILMQALRGEAMRLRRVFKESVRRRRVIGAYSK